MLELNGTKLYIYCHESDFGYMHVVGNCTFIHDIMQWPSNSYSMLQQCILYLFTSILGYHMQMMGPSFSEPFILILIFAELLPELRLNLFNSFTFWTVILHLLLKCYTTSG
jgi:hypothetical protein